MLTKVIVVSGFLGAGKTTLIQKYLQEVDSHEKIVLIENDFGETSLDSALLKNNDLEVREIKSGCICCSLIGDFVESIKEVAEKFNPEKIIIEPSGVAKLSDIIRVCQDGQLEGLAEVKNKVVVADVECCEIYLDNFGEFYEDQLTYADIVVLSRTEEFPEEIEVACKRIREVNPDAIIVKKAYKDFLAKDVLEPEDLIVNKEDSSARKNSFSNARKGGHHAEEIFDTFTIKTDYMFNEKESNNISLQLLQGTLGLVLRAKGIIKTEKGYQELQYVPGNFKLSPCEIEENFVCIIGQALNKEGLENLFNAKKA